MSPPIVRSIGHAASVRVYEDFPALSRAAAEEFVGCGRAAIDRRGRFDVALSGGSTPRQVYSLLASACAASLSWEKVHLFFGDERHVPPDDPQSNYRMVAESLLANGAIGAVPHRIEAELPAEEAANRYEQEIRRHFEAPPPAQPRFDLILLGLGTDGHTASLFPNTTALEEKVRSVVANSVPQLRTERITLTFPALNQARHILFLASGPDKAPVLAEVLGNAKGKHAYPSMSVRPVDGELVWMIDAAAAAQFMKS